jgi:hypothetical protein
LLIVELAVLFGRKLNEMHENTLYQMKDTKTNKYGGKIWKLRKGFEERSSDELKFRMEFMPFIISSIGAVPNDTMSSLKALIGKFATSVSDLWMKRIVVQVLKGSCAIWI